MKNKIPKLLTLGAATCATSNTQAATPLAAMLPLEISLAAYVIIGALAVTAVALTIFFQRREKATRAELSDVAHELGTTRSRLVDTSLELDISKAEHVATTERYSGILFDAGVGMFQMDEAGKCVFVNSALQKMSGLYPKKALKEGVETAIHPEDRAEFTKTWDAFVETNAPFDHRFRFLLAKGRETHVHCRATKVLNAKKEVESYIGWVEDDTEALDAQRAHATEIARYESFIGGAVESFYQLELKSPIALSSDPDRVAELVTRDATLAACDDTFAAMYGAQPAELIGKAISEFKDGCGPLKNNASIKALLDADCELLNLETTRQDPNGNRLNLTNSVVGIVEEGKLVGIWGAQRNISQEKREKAELSSRVGFMKRILNSLPADVHVKDTRCRYLYASKKMADRTGIPQEDWIGKTIFEVMPGTPREHDQNAIDTMKSGKTHRVERTFDARGKKGWMEIIQTPLVSDEELVEGVIALSVDITGRKLKEEEARQYRSTIETTLKHTKDDLAQSRVDYGKTATTLSETIQKLKVSEAEHANREHEFQQKLNDRKQVEETLRRSEQGLLARQQHLERQLAERLTELTAETDKRKKWEELIAIKEDELREIETRVAELSAKHEQEINLRQHAEKSLEEQRDAFEKNRAALAELTTSTELEIGRLRSEHGAALDTERQARSHAEKELARVSEFLEAAQQRVVEMTARHADELDKEIAERESATEQLARAIQDLEQLTTARERDLEKLERDHQTRFDSESKARKRAEKNLKRVKEFLESAQERAKEMTERHADELEKAVAEREATAEKLIKRMGELDELRQNFGQRLQEETKTIKQELAKKQIREKALRQHQKDMEERVKELERMLRLKSEEFAEQIQAREGAEVEKQQIEEKLEQLTELQKERIARETQRLSLGIAEIRIEEVKLRRQVGELEEVNERGAEALKERDAELERAREGVRKTETELAETRARLTRVESNQERLIAQQTNQLKNQLQAATAASEELNGRLADLKEEKKVVERTLENRETELQQAREEVNAASSNLSAARMELENTVKDRDQAIDRETKQLHLRMEGLRDAGAGLQARIEYLTDEKQAVEAKLSERETALTKAAREYRKVVDAYKETQTKLTELAAGQDAAIAKATAGLHTELKRLEHSERALRQQEAERAKDLEKRAEEINQLNLALKAEAEKRAEAEREALELKEALDDSLENADAIARQRASELKAEIEQFQLNEESLKQQLIAAEQSIKRRDATLSDLRQEHENTAARLKELEERLAGIKEEHQTEIKKSLAEVQEIAKANGALVDELNEEVQAKLEPVVRTTVLMEKSENLSDAQRDDLTAANTKCRELIDTMSYRAELTHVAEGSDEVEPAECDLHALITHIDKQFCHRAETKKLFFAVSFAQYQAGGNVPKWVETDERKLNKTLSILLGYAINRVEKGRVGLHATRLTAENGVMDIAFELTYTPSDPTDELLDGVFGSDSTNGVDMKYGLTLARQYVSMMGGEAKLARRDAGVTALTVTLPFKRGASAIIMPSSDEKQAGAA